MDTVDPQGRDKRIRAEVSKRRGASRRAREMAPVGAVFFPKGTCMFDSVGVGTQGKPKPGTHAGRGLRPVRNVLSGLANQHKALAKE